MTNSKTTKKALTASVITLVLCFLMLLGATFAWFTDTATTTVNKIQTGTLDVAIEQQTSDGNWESAENQTLGFANANDSTEILWEPSATFNLPTLRVANNGNLALKYKATFSAVSGNTELAKVIDVFCNGTKVGTLSDLLNSTDADGFAHGNLGTGANSDELKVSLQMQKSAGNTYQGMSIEGVVVTVYATQDTVESDSISNQYDKDATSTYYVYDLTELRDAVKASGNNAKIVLMDDIKITEDKDLEIVDYGKSKYGVLRIDKDMTIDLNGKTLAYTAGTEDKCWYMIYVYNAALTIIDSSGDNSGTVYGNDPDGTWAVMIRERIGGSVNIYGGHYKSEDGAVVYTNDGNINIYGGIFETEKTQNQLLHMGDYSGSICVYGGTFRNYDPSTSSRSIKLADGYTVNASTVDSNTWYTVVSEQSGE